MEKAVVIFILFMSLLYSDQIRSFEANVNDVSSMDEVSLSIDFIVTKKYQLRFSSYIDSEESAPSFRAVTLKNIIYTVPDTSFEEIRIIAELIEENTVIDTKEVILR